LEQEGTAGNIQFELFASLPSLWPEPMSYAVIQAMAYGKPVVAYDVGANDEGIVHGETGLLADWGNVEQLSLHVRSLLKDEELGLRMGRNARKRAEEMFRLDKMINSYKTLVEKVCQVKNPLDNQ